MLNWRFWKYSYPHFLFLSFSHRSKIHLASIFRFILSRSHIIHTNGQMTQPFWKDDHFPLYYDVIFVINQVTKHIKVGGYFWLLYAYPYINTAFSYRSFTSVAISRLSFPALLFLTILTTLGLLTFHIKFRVSLVTVSTPTQTGRDFFFN